MPLLSLFLPFAAFFGSSTTATSTFLLSCFQGCIGVLVAYKVEPLDGFFIGMLVLLYASTSLVKLETYKVSCCKSDKVSFLSKGKNFFMNWVAMSFLLKIDPGKRLV